MKNKISNVLMPFAKDIKTGQFLGIDEVPNGLACNCICISCGMQVKARHGNQQRTAHFAHHKKAETECQISYWVSIRSIAEQILEQATFIHIPKINNTTLIQIQSVEKGYSKEYQFTFDLKLYTSIGTVYIYFITGEGYIEGRSNFYRDHLPKYFSTSLILEIDIKSIKENHDQAKAYLRNLLLNELGNKRCVTTTYSYIQLLHKASTLEDKKETSQLPSNKLYVSIQEEQKKVIVQQNVHSIDSSFDHQDIINRLGIINTDTWVEKDYKTCERLVGFYELMNANYKPYHQAKDEYNVVYKGNNLWFVCYAGEYYYLAQLGMQYYIYDLNCNNQITFLAMSWHLAFVENRLKEYRTTCPLYQLGIKKTKLSDEDLLAYTRMIPFYKNMIHVYVENDKNIIEEYTLIDSANKFLFICYQEEYFGVVNIDFSLIVYQIVNDEIQVLLRVYSQESLEEEVKKFVDNAHQVF